MHGGFKTMAKKVSSAAQRTADETGAYPGEEAESNVHNVRKLKKPDFSKGRKLSFRIGGWWRPVKGETFSFVLLGLETKRGEDAVNDDGEQRVQIIGQLLEPCSVQRVNAKKDEEGNSVVTMASEGEVISFGDVAGLKPLKDLEMGGKFAVQVEVLGQERMKTRQGKFWNLDVTYTDMV
jgi:hypothetical protein